MIDRSYFRAPDGRGIAGVGWVGDVGVVGAGPPAGGADAGEGG